MIETPQHVVPSDTQKVRNIRNIRNIAGQRLADPEQDREHPEHRRSDRKWRPEMARNSSNGQFAKSDKISMGERVLNEALVAVGDYWKGTESQMVAMVLYAAATYAIRSFPAFGRMLFVANGPESGKGHPHGTNVLTPTGYQAVETLRVGDHVVGSDGQPTQVTGVYRRGTLPVYRVRFNDGASVRVDGSHLWNVRAHSADKHSTAYKTIDTDTLRGGIHKRYSIPMLSAPVEMPARELPLDPYVLGVLIGDGSFTRGDVYVNTGDDATMKELESRLPAGYSAKRVGDTGDFRLSRDQTRLAHGTYRNEIKEGLTDLGLWGLKSPDKFIPETYLNASAEQRLSLLRGLMDTDGELHFGREGQPRTAFSSSSEVLRDQVAWLIESFGGSVRKNTKAVTFYRAANGERAQCLPSYRLSINTLVNPFLTREGWKVFDIKKPKRVMRSIEPDGTDEVTCIRVAAADSLYVTENCIVTHNTVAMLCTAFLSNNPENFAGSSYALTSLMAKATNEEQDITGYRDEVSEIFGRSGLNSSKDPIAPVLRDGYKRGAVTMWSVNRQPERINVYMPVLMAGNGTAVPVDIRSRSIVVKSERGKPQFDLDDDGAEERLRLIGKVLGSQVRKHVEMYSREIRAYNCDGVLPKLTGRKHQVWRPLIAIAKFMGGERWYRMALDAFTELTGGTGAAEVLSPDQETLRDMCEILAELQLKPDTHVSGKMLSEELWSRHERFRGRSPEGVSHDVARAMPIEPRKRRTPATEHTEAGNFRGYWARDILKAWEDARPARPDEIEPEGERSAFDD